MKRLILLLVALCGALTASFTASATATAAAPATAGRAAEILEKLTAGFRAMPAYGVAFSVAAADFASQGSYAVMGERYYLVLGDAEVFCDGKTRYEVDKRRREVTITDVDSSSRNILNNPAHAFEFLGSEYNAELLWERDGKAALRLMPSGRDNSSAGVVTLTLSTATMRPMELSYDYDGERIGIAIRSVEPLREPLKSFDKSAYAGYEWIDFR